MVWIFCEGNADKAFFEELIKVRMLPSAKIEVLEGTDNYASRLENLAVSELAKNKPKHLLFTRDNDNNPSTSFQKVIKALKSANKKIQESGIDWKISVPTEPRHWTGDAYRAAIYMFPAMDKNGALESLLLEYLEHHVSDYQRCADGFVQCIQAQDSSNIDKLKLRLLLCAITKDPNISVAKLWERNRTWRKASYKIDLIDPIFDDIANFLQEIAT